MNGTRGEMCVWKNFENLEAILSILFLISTEKIVEWLIQTWTVFVLVWNTRYDQNNILFETTWQISVIKADSYMIEKAVASIHLYRDPFWLGQKNTLEFLPGHKHRSKGLHYPLAHFLPSGKRKLFQMDRSSSLRMTRTNHSERNMQQDDPTCCFKMYTYMFKHGPSWWSRG